MTIRLVGAQEIRSMLAPIKRRRMYKLARRADFPSPAGALAQGKVWRADEVEAWIVTHRSQRPVG